MISNGFLGSPSIVASDIFFPFVEELPIREWHVYRGIILIINRCRET